MMEKMTTVTALKMLDRGFMPDDTELEDELFKDGYGTIEIDEIRLEMENIIANFEQDETNKQIDAELKKDFFSNLK